MGKHRRHDKSVALFEWMTLFGAFALAAWIASGSAAGVALAVGAVAVGAGMGRWLL